MTAKLELSLNLQQFGFESRFEASISLQGVTSLFGPSGSGKTRILRAIAGLDRLSDTAIKFDDQCWQSSTDFVSPASRDIGYVFQEPSLFLHLCVADNIAYAQRRVRNPKTNAINLSELTELLNISHLMRRPSHAISVGEQQRVSIARALASQPRLLLMDEPLSALDEGHKAEILPLLERVCTSCNTPILYVTHAQEEVARLADEIILIEQGQSVASGPIETEFPRIGTRFLQGEKAGSVVRGKVSSYDERFGLIRVSSAIGELFTAGKDHLALGDDVRLKLDARDISIALSKAGDTSILNLIEATVVDCTELDTAHVLVKLKANKHDFLAKITKRSYFSLSIEAGKSVYAQIKSVALI